MKVGTLEVTDTLFITDPCYNLDTWCTKTIEMPFGNYNCYVNKSTKHKIINSLYIIQDGYKLGTNCYINSEEVGECGVDSGQLGIFNISKFKKKVSETEFKKSLKKKFPYEDWKRQYNPNDNDKDSFYKCCCNHTLNKSGVGIINNVGVVSSSGHGDGSYPVYLIQAITEEGKKTVGLYIQFCF